MPKNTGFCVPLNVERNALAKKFLIVLATFCLVVGVTLAAGNASAPGSVRVAALTEASPCPVTGCASGTCHGFDNVPEPDGTHELVCPESGCAALDCHAWEALTGRYHKASDASLNLWILLPTVLVVGLVLMLKKVGGAHAGK